MIELDEILEVLEVLRDEGETLVVEGVGGGIFVLVEGVEMSGGEVFEDGTGMSAATKGDVGIYALGDADFPIHPSPAFVAMVLWGNSNELNFPKSVPNLFFV